MQTGRSKEINKSLRLRRNRQNWSGRIGSACHRSKKPAFDELKKAENLAKEDKTFLGLSFVWLQTLKEDRSQGFHDPGYADSLPDLSRKTRALARRNKMATNRADCRPVHSAIPSVLEAAELTSV
jgi:hypothetical protein